MISIITNIVRFAADPKNTRMLMFAGILLFALLFLKQCNATQRAKAHVKLEQQDKQRIKNNWKASSDTLVQFKIKDFTNRAQILGYELTLEELETEHSRLLADFEIERNKPPKVIIKTEYIIREVIKEVPVYVTIDSNGVKQFEFNDSVNHNKNNWRTISGKIPFIIDTLGLKPKVIPGNGNFTIQFGMNLNLGLFQDKDTKKIMIKVDSDYPGIRFTSIEGASILDNPKNKKALNSLKKSFGLGVNIGYGASFNNGNILAGPYIGLGLGYHPKFLQW
jgi:hypothetical protein